MAGLQAGVCDSIQVSLLAGRLNYLSHQLLRFFCWRKKFSPVPTSQAGSWNLDPIQDSSPRHRMWDSGIPSSFLTPGPNNCPHQLFSEISLSHFVLTHFIGIENKCSHIHHSLFTANKQPYSIFFFSGHCKSQSSLLKY